MDDAGVPWSVRLRAALIRPFSTSRWPAIWIKYWESQGISEAEQMRMADDAEERMRMADDAERGTQRGDARY